MSRATGDFSWRSLAVPVLLPTLLYATGAGAILPVVPMFASRLGALLFDDASTVLAVAGVVASLLMLGELIGNIPSGWLVGRIGERNAMIAAACLSIVGLIVCVLATTPWHLGAGVLLTGLATSVFGLARHAFVVSYVPFSHRARALATVGGLFRFGYFVGPFITAAVLTMFVSFESAFWIHVAMCFASAIVLLFVRDPAKAMNDLAEAPVARSRGSLFRTIAARSDVLLRLGSGAAVISALRAGKMVVLPLWGVSIGLPDVATTTIIGIAGGVDFALFYLGGWLMDRHGRLWNAIPSTVGISITFLLLAFTHDLAAAVPWFIVLAMLMSVANGLGSGIILTLGADLADPGDPAPFLGAWRFTGSLGNAAAPLAIAAVTAAISLPFAVAALGVVGFAGAGLLARYIPRYPATERPLPSTRNDSASESHPDTQP
ncbi:MFS transporter [Ruicaihuangia caeni]|uniref:MFS transporter n=1 Tax=Ruicaihuangia caeni TaxID=3042517 RepID=A0AAW6T4E8_9MICO|nr:MFS transporter [Klugiella sp. YN-L-19]MDI2098706.1 MFS transporter [Klugiella sp. YN-L-19]